ncbi:MAG: 4,5-DOPA dioxygenase extradiol [Bacteriovoracaceae bacterium]|nr:4,5-DOPA dioxygenase extradiol [Bacteriovoracaceae bacterium]
MTGLLVKAGITQSGPQKSVRMPTMFLGHGSPMNAIQNNSFTEFLSAFPKDMPKPSAILSVSAHWETRGTKVLKVDKPKTIHDFGGFPEALYKIQYPAAGAPQIADKVIDLVKLHQVEADSSWGLDHGTWTLLKFMYPEADIPVLQLSLNQNLTLEDHLRLAVELKPLRDQGVLIMGSGNVTHNLRRVVWQESAKPVDWAVEFDEMIKKALLEKDLKTLLGKDSKSQSLWQVAHPSLEHYLPLLYAYGASDEKEQVKFIHESMELGSLSMRSMTFG